jgi:hypothetical protein
MRNLLRSPRTFVLAAVLAAACDGGTPVNPPRPSGVYVLESVTGRGPTSGTFTLTADGHAERQVHYAAPGSPLDQRYVGSYTVEGTTITFNLVPAETPAAYVWPVSGQWLGSQFTIRYGDPADGPDIVETYKRH